MTVKTTSGTDGPDADSLPLDMAGVVFNDPDVSNRQREPHHRLGSGREDFRRGADSLLNH